MRDLARAGGAALVALLVLAAPVAAHELNERYEAPLPLIAYVAGAALAVAISFAFVMMRSATPRAGGVASDEAATGSVPIWLRRLLQAVGLIAWIWIALQALFGGVGAGDVASLFLWIYGWVGVALVSALIGPIWPWLDPFSTIHELLGRVAGRLGLGGGTPATFPASLGRWPAVIGFLVILWLELVGRVEGGRTLGLFLIAYTFVTVAGMSLYGRQTWRAHAEIFSVWFDLLGRLAPRALVGTPEDGRLLRRRFGSGLLSADWSLAELVFVALGTGAIIFDGLSQTEIYFNVFVAPAPLGGPLLRDSITATVFLGLLVLVAVGTARLLSVRSVAAGLLPVAVGYLVAHYLTYLLIDGQRIVAALNDPLLRGDNLLPLDLSVWEPSSFIPVSIAWSIQLAAVVGGHVLGAWSGHAALADEEGRAPIGRQLPLALLMVALTTITLWSLGQAIIVEPGA